MSPTQKRPRPGQGSEGAKNKVVTCTSSVPCQGLAVNLEKSARRDWKWTPAREKQAGRIVEVAEGLSDYWPLTLRQLYYQLVAAGDIKNTRSKYNDLSVVTKQMRLDGLLPWNALEDRVRRVSAKRGFNDADDFIDRSLNHFLRGYSRCLVQGQERYVEVWCEKDALSAIFEDVAWGYCLRCVTCRGYQSVSFLNDYADRAEAAMEQGQTPVVLYFGDMDPSGVQMLEASKQTLEDDLGVRGVGFVRVALNPWHISEYGLPCNPDALKMTDMRAKKYVRRFGEIAVELDALHPSVLADMARGAIENQFDMDLMEAQREVEKADRAKIDALREQVKAVMTSHNGGGAR